MKTVRIWIDEKTHRLVQVQEDYTSMGTPTIYLDKHAYYNSENKLMLVGEKDVR